MSDKNIFISWSNVTSGAIAKELRTQLEYIFEDMTIEFFMSQEDIESGDDWEKVIKEKLDVASVGILCVTQENIDSPWLLYEAGRIAGNGGKVIPLLINVNVSNLLSGPLHTHQCIDFYDKNDFFKLIKDIGKKIGHPIRNTEKKGIYSTYEEILRTLKPALTELQSYRLYNEEKYSYPSEIHQIENNSIFISSPMLSIATDDEKYKTLNTQLSEIKIALEEIGFKKIVSPGLEICSPDDFDEPRIAIRKNFTAIKQSEALLVIYPNNKKLSRSVLIEVGFAISKCKKIAFFYSDGLRLPYMLENANDEIKNFHKYKFKDYSKIAKNIRKSGKLLFGIEPITLK